ncbi:MAG: glutaredoxin family protein [Gammaproteobacteria bacterium]|nr:glutaredoxin family protein [Gammaproteobacteria bacterium]
MSGGKTRLLLLSRPDCHLCEELADELRAAFSGAYELAEACVDERLEWKKAYGREIPVLLTESGEVLCRSFFDPEPVRRHLRAATPVLPDS